MQNGRERIPLGPNRTFVGLCILLDVMIGWLTIAMAVSHNENHWLYAYTAGAVVSLLLMIRRVVVGLRHDPNQPNALGDEGALQPRTNMPNILIQGFGPWMAAIVVYLIGTAFN